MVLDIQRPANDDLHPENDIHVPIIRNFVLAIEASESKQQKINIAFDMMNYFMEHINWLLLHQGFRLVMIDKACHFIENCQENEQFVQRCNDFLRAVGEPEYYPEQEQEEEYDEYEGNNDNDESSDDDIQFQYI